MTHNRGVQQSAAVTGVKPPYPGTTVGQTSQGAGLCGHLPGVMCQESWGFLNRRSQVRVLPGALTSRCSRTPPVVSKPAGG